MQPHRSSALGYASAASAVHSRVYGACTAEAAASESSRLSVGGCIRSRRYFGPHPVPPYSVRLYIAFFCLYRSVSIIGYRSRGKRNQPQNPKTRVLLYILYMET